jgi:hypothetical protein
VEAETEIKKVRTCVWVWTYWFSYC